MAFIGGVTMSNNILDIHQGKAYPYTYSAEHEPIAKVDPGQTVRIHCVDCFENLLVFLLTLELALCADLNR